MPDAQVFGMMAAANNAGGKRRRRAKAVGRTTPTAAAGPEHTRPRNNSASRAPAPKPGTETPSAATAKAKASLLPYMSNPDAAALAAENAAIRRKRREKMHARLLRHRSEMDVGSKRSNVSGAPALHACYAR